MGDLSTNFSRVEFKCHCCGKLPKDPPADFLAKLEKARALYYPKGLFIYSGYRCPAWNRKVGGKGGSRHTVPGDAIDFRVPRMTLAQARALGFRGVGIVKATGLVLHVDNRPTPAVWYYDENGNTP